MLALCELGTQRQMFLNCIIFYFMLVFNFIMYFLEKVMKLLVSKLKWKKGKMDVHRVFDNRTSTHPFFEKHILSHEIFKKFFTIEEMERIYLESNKYARYKSNHSFMMIIKSWNNSLPSLCCAVIINFHHKKCIGRGERITRTEWSRR